MSTEHECSIFFGYTAGKRAYEALVYANLLDADMQTVPIGDIVHDAVELAVGSAGLSGANIDCEVARSALLERLEAETVPKIEDRIEIFKSAEVE